MGDVGCYCLNFCRAIMGTEPNEWDAAVRYSDQNVDIEALVPCGQNIEPNSK